MKFYYAILLCLQPLLSNASDNARTATLETMTALGVVAITSGIKTSYTCYSQITKHNRLEAEYDAIRLKRDAKLYAVPGYNNSTLHDELVHSGYRKITIALMPEDLRDTLELFLGINPQDTRAQRTKLIVEKFEARLQQKRVELAASRAQLTMNKNLVKKTLVPTAGLTCCTLYCLALRYATCHDLF